MIVVTGATGFIGANLIYALNQRGITDIAAVDDFSAGKAPARIANLADLSVAEHIDKHEFRAAIANWQRAPVSVVFHQGACADTMVTDEKYVMDNNLAYSKDLYHFCAKQNAQYLYASSASVYGAGEIFVESPQHESALNLYAQSKLLFDQFVRERHDDFRGGFQCVGLRYFNVYGPREAHKERMASVAWHFFNQYRNDGQVKLFEGDGDYANGEQRRDFVSVEDVVAVNLFFMDNRTTGGIYNCGSGRSRTFNEIALAVINACRQRDNQSLLSIADAVNAGAIAYIPMPDALRGKYQSYTEADLHNLRAAGYDAAFLDIETGVGNYVDALTDNARQG